MIGLMILAGFLIGWFGDIAVYKYGLKNSPVILPPENRYDAFRETKTRIDTDYEVRLKEYNTKAAELAKKRKKFYEENPDHPCTTMYMQVTAPPQKISIQFI